MLKSVQIIYETVGQIKGLEICCWIGLDKPNHQKCDGKDQRADGQQKSAGQSCQATAFLLGNLNLFLFQLLVIRLDLDNTQAPIWSTVMVLEHLLGGVSDHFKEGDGHREEHPDVDHLDVWSDRQALRDAKKAENLNDQINK